MEAQVIGAMERRPEEFEGFMHITCADEGGALLAGYAPLTPTHRCHDTVPLRSMRLAAALSAHATEFLLWRFEHLGAESHGSVLHRSLIDGLEFVFSRYGPSSEQVRPIYEI